MAFYNVLGELVNAYDLGLLEPGYYSLEWEALDHRGKSLDSGVYFYRLTAGDLAETKKIVLLK